MFTNIKSMNLHNTVRLITQCNDEWKSFYDVKLETARVFQNRTLQK